MAVSVNLPQRIKEGPLGPQATLLHPPAVGQGHGQTAGL